MRLQHHFLRLSWICHNEHLAAVGQTEMGDLDVLQDTTELYLLVAPVELAGITGHKQQRHKCLGQLGAVMAASSV